MTFSTLTKEDIGETITVLAKVEHIHQTTGPTLFKLFDGTAHFVAKAFLNPGERAYPKIEKGMVVEAVLRIQEYEGKLEGGISSIEYRDAALFEQQLEKLREAHITVESIPFLITSEPLEKLRDRIESAALLIKKAIYENRPIIIRHNADCDGYSGAVALEKVILRLIIAHHGDDYAQWKYYKRAASRAPFYSVSDGMNDAASIANDMMRGTKAPLVIIVDNGSGKEDLFAIRQVKLYGCQVIVVDHHFVEDDVISAEVDVHINPYLVGYHSQLCAGMLSAELARFVGELRDVYIPALAGVGDKVESEEMKQYVLLAEKEGYMLSDLKRIALCLDYVAYYLRGEGRAFVQGLFGQKVLVELIYADARKKMDMVLEVAKHYVQVEEKNGKTLAVLDLSGVSSMGEFPAFGKITGLVSDWLNEIHGKGVYVFGLGRDMIVIRVSKSETAFNLNVIVQQLKKEKPYASISGGGHERAGTIRFAAAAREEVLEFVKEFIGK